MGTIAEEVRQAVATVHKTLGSTIAMCVIRTWLGKPKVHVDAYARGQYVPVYIWMR